MAGAAAEGSVALSSSAAGTLTFGRGLITEFNSPPKMKIDAQT